jgi:hypothetical protein
MATNENLGEYHDRYNMDDVINDSQLLSSMVYGDLNHHRSSVRRLTCAKNLSVAPTKALRPNIANVDTPSTYIPITPNPSSMRRLTSMIALASDPNKSSKHEVPSTDIQSPRTDVGSMRRLTSMVALAPDSDKSSKSGTTNMDVNSSHDADTTLFPGIKDVCEPETSLVHWNIILDKLPSAPTDLFISMNTGICRKYIIGLRDIHYEVIGKFDPALTARELTTLTYDHMYACIRDLDRRDVDILFKQYDVPFESIIHTSTKKMYRNIFPRPLNEIIALRKIDIHSSIRMLHNDYLGWETTKYKWDSPQFRTQIDILRKLDPKAHIDFGTCIETVVSPFYINKGQTGNNHLNINRRHSCCTPRFKGSAASETQSIKLPECTPSSDTISQQRIFREWTNSNLHFTLDHKDIIDVKALYTNFTRWYRKKKGVPIPTISHFNTYMSRDILQEYMSNNCQFVFKVKIKT